MPVILSSGTKERRDTIRDILANAGIQTSIHYPAIHRFSIYADGTKLPQTEYVSDHEFTLPMYASLTDEEIGYICDNVRKAIYETK